MADPVPEAADAMRAARPLLGEGALSVRRFDTGLAFFVFEVAAAAGRVVVRMGRPGQRTTLSQGVALAAQLRPLGVPLPRLLVDGTDSTLPFVILERLEGSDLGDHVAGFSPAQKRHVAEAVAAAQRAVAHLGTGSRYGYAPSAGAAPHATWPALIAASLARSRTRLEANGLFDPACATRMELLVRQLHPRLAAIPATPFLHDTTTKNVIVTPEGRFSGIVDVDDLCFGDPRYAIALTRTALLAHGLPADYAAIWLDLSGHEDDALMHFYTALFVLDFMSEHGMVFNGNARPSDKAQRARLETLFARILRPLT